MITLLHLFLTLSSQLWICLRLKYFIHKQIPHEIVTKTSFNINIINWALHLYVNQFFIHLLTLNYIYIFLFFILYFFRFLFFTDVYQIEKCKNFSWQLIYMFWIFLQYKGVFFFFLKTVTVCHAKISLNCFFVLLCSSPSWLDQWYSRYLVVTDVAIKKKRRNLSIQIPKISFVKFNRSIVLWSYCCYLFLYS